MAAYSSYAYRGKPHEDEWNDSTIYCEDGVCRTVIVDPDGRKTTAIGCSPFHEDVDSYVVHSETIEHVYNPRVNEYRHSSPRKNVEYGGHEKWRRPSSPDRPKELDDFFNGIQIEASRPHHKNNNPKLAGGAATNWRPNTHPHSNGYGGGYNNKPTAGSYPIRNEKFDDYYRKKSPTRDWERPVNHGTRPVNISSPVGGRDARLGVPTNSIEEAIDYLKGENARISSVPGINHGGGGGGGNQGHFVRQYVQPPRVYEAEDIPPRHQYPASSTWPRTTSPPTHGRAYPPGVIDSHEAARRFGGKIVRI
ncbi:uncharacterized protein LOC112490703 [Ziziphus jujuba]|uniref:Uncharacterized protein LOC112490703 n=2 Tax=Ziziphus jujuba TaxID=326968 RepID=A0A6P6FXQ2_ZIZJJ|nr:uncharacterized protein LOC112490703 [Ziziphus jujuba]KAH7543189.1 hypothetical protein FEM48_Zijuj02G0157100 [Ziziphus jujuba var. spinosa]